MAAQNLNPFGDRIHKFDLLAVLLIEEQLQLIGGDAGRNDSDFCRRYRSQRYRGIPVLASLQFVPKAQSSRYVAA